MSDDRIFIYKRSNGIYYIGRRVSQNRISENRISQSRIQWKSTKCRKKPDAIAFSKSFSFDGPAQADEKTSLTLSALLNLYIERQKHSLRPGSMRNNEDAVKAFLRMFGDRLLSLYTVADVEDFKNSFLNRGLTKETSNANYRGIKTVFSFGVKHDFLEKNIFSQCKQFKVEQKRPPFLSAEDFQKLLSVVREPVLKEVFLFAALTGLRLNELTNLRWSNIDPDQKKITIENSDSFRTKSGKIRTIPMNDQIVTMMQRLNAERRPGREFVFAKPNGYKFENGFVSHRFKAYVRISGLNEGLHFHCLRHTFASHLVSAGVSLYIVQNLLGHANVSTTTVYSSLAPNSLQDAINKLSL